MAKDDQDKPKTQDQEKPWDKKFTDDRDSEGNLSRVATRQKSRGTTILSRVVWVLIALLIVVPVVTNALATNSGNPDKNKITIDSDSKSSSKKSSSSTKSSTKSESSKQSTSTASSQTSSTVSSSSSTAPKESSSSSSSSTKDAAGTYTVKAGDNAYRIAVNHGMTLDEFYQINGMNRNSVLSPGMVVKVK